MMCCKGKWVSEVNTRRVMVLCDNLVSGVPSAVQDSEGYGYWITQALYCRMKRILVHTLYGKCQDILGAYYGTSEVRGALTTHKMI